MTNNIIHFTITFHQSVTFQSYVKLTKGHPRTRRLVVDPKGNPRKHHNQDGGEVSLEHKVTDVSL